MITDTLKINSWLPQFIDSSKLDTIEFLYLQKKDTLQFFFLFNKETYVVDFYRFESFRFTNEENLIKYWEMINKEEKGNVFYTVENSIFLKELNALSIDFFASGGNEGLKHYLFSFPDDCIEVITDLPPEIKKV